MCEQKITNHSTVYISVTFVVKSRRVSVKGPRGTLIRSFRHLAVDMRKVSKDELIVEKWFGIHKELAAVRTVCSHIENMIKGVIKVSHGSYCFRHIRVNLFNIGTRSVQSP